jgi:hypothetical protein
MSSAVVGTARALELQLSDGTAGLFPQAEVYPSNWAVPLATVSLADLGGGLYSANYTFTSASQYFIKYRVYSDAGHTTPDTTYSIELENILAQVNSIDTIPGSVLTELVDATYTLGDYMKIMAAVLAGKASGGPGNPVFRDLLDTKDVVDGVADVNGNRTSAIYNP